MLPTFITLATKTRQLNLWEFTRLNTPVNAGSPSSWMHPHFIRGNIDGLYQITLSERSSASSQMIENNPTLQPNADFTPINDPPHQSTNYEDEEELTSLIWRSNAHADDNTVIPEFTTEEQRIRYNRERSREHSRKTRIRKKEYVERLKISFDELRRERDTLLSERTSASSQMIETHSKQVDVLSNGNGGELSRRTIHPPPAP